MTADDEKARIWGGDGDQIIELSIENPAHLMTPRDVGEYLMEMHRKHTEGK